MKYQQFEELPIWQNSRILVANIYALTRNIKDYGFCDQIQRAAVSIMNNITEGFESGTDAKFRTFLNVAKGSCGEVRSMLYLIKDLDYAEEQTENIAFCENLSSQITGLIKYLENN